MAVFLSLMVVMAISYIHKNTFIVAKYTKYLYRELKYIASVPAYNLQNMVTLRARNMTIHDQHMQQSRCAWH